MASGGWGYNAPPNPFATAHAEDADASRPAAATTSTGAWGNAPAVPFEVQQAALGSAAPAGKKSGFFGNRSNGTSAAMAAAPAVVALGAAGVNDLSRREQEVQRREQEVARREAALNGGAAAVAGGKTVVRQRGRCRHLGDGGDVGFAGAALGCRSLQQAARPG